MIHKVAVLDKRFKLESGAGSDSIYHDPVYSYALTELTDDTGIKGVGLTFTPGGGNDLVCKAAAFYAEKLKGNDIEELMSDFGRVFNELSNEQQFRWFGPHKGIARLALASVTNACYDLWAKKKGIPLWKLLIDLSPEQIVATLDLSYVEDVLTKREALILMNNAFMGIKDRYRVLNAGYACYDSSVGWLNYDDEQVMENCKLAIAKGFTALKLKVGSANPERDIRRADIVREVAGDECKVMLDANHQWNLRQATSVCKALRSMDPYWIEEPIHPDDVLAHKVLAGLIAPTKIALGRHVPNSVLFKNYLQTGCAAFMQPDALRLGGVSEFITVSLLCKKFGVPVVPHGGDMGQLHQHLVLFNHIALGHEALFLEHNPHLQQQFVHPAKVVNGFYQVPQEPGCSCDLIK